MNDVINRYLFQLFSNGIEIIATPFHKKRNAVALYNRYYNLYSIIKDDRHIILRLTDFDTGGVIEEYDSQQADC
jgi:hypothetical protein